MSTGPISDIRDALLYWEHRQAAMSHNLANTSTNGYKAERVFATLLDGARLQTRTETSFANGALSPTGRPLDVALDGPGFLVVQTEQGLRYTRNGSLTIDDAGLLVDSRGNPVLGRQGTIVLPPGEIEIQTDGTILVDDAPMGTLRVDATPRDGPPLRREGSHYFVAPARAARIEPGTTSIRQGHIEQSNMDPIEALVEMLEIQRAYSAIQRSAQIIDGVMQTTARDLGRLR